MDAQKTSSGFSVAQIVQKNPLKLVAIILRIIVIVSCLNYVQVMHCCSRLFNLDFLDSITIFNCMHCTCKYH